MFIAKIAEPKLVTGNRNDILKIDVTLNPFHSPSTFTVEDQQIICDIYDLIQETRNIIVIRHPNHSEGDHTDSSLHMTIYYKNGKSDFLKSGENIHSLSRILETKGDGGYGFVGGYNESLWDYLNNIKDKYDATTVGAT
jgi:hypothetical protein